MSHRGWRCAPPRSGGVRGPLGSAIDVLAAYRPTGNGRVERQVNIVRDHVIAGRSFDSIAELDGAFAGWLRSAAVRSTAATARSSPSGLKLIGPP